MRILLSEFMKRCKAAGIDLTGCTIKGSDYNYRVKDMLDSDKRVHVYYRPDLAGAGRFGVDTAIDKIRLSLAPIIRGAPRSKNDLIIIYIP